MVVAKAIGVLFVFLYALIGGILVGYIIASIVANVKKAVTISWQVFKFKRETKRLSSVDLDDEGE